MGLSPEQTSNRFKMARSSVAIAASFLLVGGILLTGGRTAYAGPHTILDSAVFLLSGLLAWQSWDLGARLDRIFPKWLSITFAVTCALEFIHTLVTVEFTGVLVPVEQAANLLRPITWGPAAYVLPLGIGIGLWMTRRGGRGIKLGLFGLCVFAVGSSLAFRLVPGYSPPGWLGISRPNLVLVPLLWAALGWVCWRFRATDRNLPTMTMMSAVLCVGHIAMLYSRAPHDTFAVIAHLGKASGYLMLLVALMQMASSDMLQLIQVEDNLRMLAIRADEANASKSRFLAMMSHELRTPMTGVLGMADLLLSSGLTPEQEKFTHTLARSGRTLMGLLNDVLDFSKIEAGQMQIEHMPFSLSAILDDMRDLFAGIASEKGIVLRIEMPPVFQDEVVGDVTRMRQVLSNLIGNAIKFTGSGHITVSLRQNAARDGMLSVGFSVADTGIGIASEKVDRLFQPFAQADVSITRKFGGTGLGLAISRSLVRAMGGDINVVSSEGQGSTFSFFVHMKSGADSVAADRPKRAGAPASGKKNLCILLADDNATTRMLVSIMFGRMGHNVTAVDDGAQAVAAIQTGPYDLILMDMQMPVMDGPDAMIAIRRMERDGAISRRIPIIALTADARPEGREGYLAAGADAFASKPIDWEVLTAAIDTLIPGGASGDPAATPGNEIIAADVVMTLRQQLGAAPLGKLLQSFADELSALRAEMVKARDSGDLRQCMRAAHNLVGVAETFGARRVGALARALEGDAKTIEDAAAALPALLASIDAAQEVIVTTYLGAA